MRALLHTLAFAIALPLVSCGSQAPEQDPDRSSAVASPPAAQIAVSDTVLRARIERLSEPGGFFDTDNLISNESSYLHPVDKMERMGVQGGAYIGVGPDQNFSYMASVRPSIAFIVDVRRDNLLQQLMFKALFHDSANRLEYLCRWVGRPCPEDLYAWNNRSIEELVDAIDHAAADPEYVEAVRTETDETIRSFGLELAEADYATIDRFHRTFTRSGLDLRFQSFGRPPRWFYPTLRQLLLETDLAGRQVNYLAAEDDFQFVKSLQEDNLVIPVVGDLAGRHSVKEIGTLLDELGEAVSALYTSNVEFYLFRGGTFDRFADNVAALPLQENGVIIRSYFRGGFRSPALQAMPGYYSAQLLQTLESFAEQQAAGGYRSYNELLTLHSLDLTR